MGAEIAAVAGSPVLGGAYLASHLFVIRAILNW